MGEGDPGREKSLFVVSFRLYLSKLQNAFVQIVKLRARSHGFGERRSRSGQSLFVVSFRKLCNFNAQIMKKKKNSFMYNGWFYKILTILGFAASLELKILY